MGKREKDKMALTAVVVGMAYSARTHQRYTCCSTRATTSLMGDDRNAQYKPLQKHILKYINFL